MTHHHFVDVGYIAPGGGGGKAKVEKSDTTFMQPASAKPMHETPITSPIGSGLVMEKWIEMCRGLPCPA